MMKKNVNGIEIELTPEEILLKQKQDAEELAKRQAEEEKAEQDRLARIAKEEQEKARKESAIAKLKALGLTEEEVKSIL